MRQIFQLHSFICFAGFLVGSLVIAGCGEDDAETNISLPPDLPEASSAANFTADDYAGDMTQCLMRNYGKRATRNLIYQYRGGLYSKFSGCPSFSLFSARFDHYLNVSIVSSDSYVDGDPLAAGYYIYSGTRTYDTASGSTATVHEFVKLEGKGLEDFKESLSAKQRVDHAIAVERFKKRQAEEKAAAEKAVLEHRQNMARYIEQAVADLPLENIRGQIVVQASLRDKIKVELDEEFVGELRRIKVEKDWVSLLILLRKSQSGYEWERKEPMLAKFFTWVDERTYPEQNVVEELIGKLRHFEIRMRITTTADVYGFHPDSGCSGYVIDFYGNSGQVALPLLKQKLFFRARYNLDSVFNRFADSLYQRYLGRDSSSGVKQMPVSETAELREVRCKKLLRDHEEEITSWLLTH